MKPSKQQTTDLRPAAAGSTPSSTDLAALLASIEEQELALATSKAAAEKALYQDGITRAKLIVSGLAARGHRLSQIAKALGLFAKPHTPATAAGPATNRGWFQLFRSRSIQAYLRSHPDLSASFRDQKLPSADYPSHIPSADITAIDIAAQTKADARCPSPSISA